MVAPTGDIGFSLRGGGAWTPPATVDTSDGGFAQAREIDIELTDQVNTCVVGGDYVTGVAKSGENFLSLSIMVAGDALPTPGTYTVDYDPMSPRQLFAMTGQVGCGADAAAAISGGTTIQANAQNTVTLTEVTASEVKGSYSFVMPNASGTFDVPVCPTVVAPPEPCCIP